MRHLQPSLAYWDERIAAVTATDERVRRLQSVPHVGPVTAAACVAAIDEASRFHRGHEVEAYLGLVPRELSSGETQRRGRITKAGSSRVRWLLIQAAVSMLRLRDSRTATLRELAGRLAARRGKGIAVVALARRPLRALARWHRVRAAPTPGLLRCAGRASLTDCHAVPGTISRRFEGVAERAMLLGPLPESRRIEGAPPLDSPHAPASCGSLSSERE